MLQRKESKKAFMYERRKIAAKLILPHDKIRKFVFWEKTAQAKIYR